MQRFNPFASIGFGDEWFSIDTGFGGSGAELGERGYEGRTADESRPGWTPNPQAFEPFNTYLGVDPYTGNPIRKSSPDAEAMLRLGLVIDDDKKSDPSKLINHPSINFALSEDATGGQALRAGVSFIDTWTRGGADSGLGEIFIDTAVSYWDEQDQRVQEFLKTFGDAYWDEQDQRWGLSENVEIIAKRDDAALPPGDSAFTTSPKVSAPPPAPPTRDWTTSPTGPAPPWRAPPTRDSAFTPSPTGSSPPFPTPWSAPPPRDSAFTAPPTRSAGPSPASGGLAERAISARGHIIAPLPPISGSRDALLFNPPPGYGRYFRERGREAAERKANPDARDFHDIYTGLVASPLAALEDLFIGVVNLPHDVVNRGTRAGEHIGRGYLLAVERGEYAEAYAEYLYAIIDLSVGFLQLGSLAKPGSAGEPQGASLGPKLETSLPAAEVRLAEEAEALATEGVSEGSWIRLSRSRAEADAFDRTVQQVSGELQRPPNKLGGGPNKWGSTFNNRPLQPGRPPELPITLGPYKEYTTLLSGQTTRGELRTVIGGNGEIFTTWTHYGTSQPFFPIDPLEQLARVTFLRLR